MMKGHPNLRQQFGEHGSYRSNKNEKEMKVTQGNICRCHLDCNISLFTGKTVLYKDFLGESHFLQSLLNSFPSNGTTYY